MRSTFSTVLIALAAVEVAVAVQPLGGFMAIAKRQAVCVGPVICEQSATTCTSCETGFYCSGGGCCEDGQICSGFKPCVDAGTPVRDAEQTQVCPTDAPICTASDLIPVCSGSLEDWATISAGLGGAQTTDIDTPIFTTPSFTAPSTSTEFEPEFTSTSEFEVESTTTFEESTTPAPTFEVETTEAPETTDAAETTSSRRTASTTSSAPSGSSTPNSGVKMQFSLGLVAGLIVATSILL
ncbi:hypothetical protein TWF106_007078 [Orbilia oligospora]|uniref:Extracellular membrane protein CFEM domain-containing protein n=1 Tax=Orbilia oligospora TaxID=2813651 RepID=A0A6G1M4F1_ORBOL|nr:hypothetical protein TWF679_003450 [Orbilia oligospora]KAF3219234.1 hypothetical protein TWF106_007078 [Orbilia oligospora]KAF3220475.1 hypothetical protein TWF191_007376 [Orbilia oligospora]KAF3244768.1 hypothetical protein TWF192_007699 [Orbilia oligospora]